MPSIPIPYAIGADLWYADSSRVEETHPCPSCAGTLQHHVILGNGEEADIPCATCGHPGPPTGVITRSVHTARATPFKTDGVRMSFDDFIYTDSQDRGVNAKYLFLTKDQALVHAQRRVDEAHKYAEEQEVRNIASKKRGLAWSIHYWARQVKSLERQVERARNQYRISKEKKNA